MASDDALAEDRNRDKLLGGTREQRGSLCESNCTQSLFMLASGCFKFDINGAAQWTPRRPFNHRGNTDMKNVIWYLLTGISGKSQVLFALVFTTRYLDLLTAFISLYNTSMKVNALALISCI